MNSSLSNESPAPASIQGNDGEEVVASVTPTHPLLAVNDPASVEIYDFDFPARDHWLQSSLELSKLIKHDSWGPKAPAFPPFVCASALTNHGRIIIEYCLLIWCVLYLKAICYSLYIVIHSIPSSMEAHANTQSCAKIHWQSTVRAPSCSHMDESPWTPRT